MAKAVEVTTDDPVLPMTLSQLRELLGTQASGITPEMLAAIMARTAQDSAAAMQKALKPENHNHPGISAISYPEGDEAHPRKDLPYQLFWKGYPINRDLDLSAWWELEAYHYLKPGDYVVSRKDGAPMKVSVRAVMANDGVTTEQVWVEFDLDREVRNLVAQPLVMCYQMAHREMSRDDSFVGGMSLLLILEMRDRKAKAAKSPEERARLSQENSAFLAEAFKASELVAA